MDNEAGEKIVLNEQQLDDAIGEAFYNFYHGLDSNKCVTAIRIAFKQADYHHIDPSKLTVLSDEEINELDNKFREDPMKELYINRGHTKDFAEYIAQAQLAQDKKVLEG